MKNETKTLMGILITILIFLISIAITKVIKVPIGFIPSGFMTNSMELILTGISIYYFQSKGLLTFKIKPIKIKIFFIVILTSIIAFVVVNFLTMIIYKICHISPQEQFNPFLRISPWQHFIFVLIYASIAEEILFRGFLLNMLSSLTTKGINLFKIRLSFPVIISGALFGLVHLVLLSTGASIAFVLKIVFLTMTLGSIAGYFQEKYENNTTLGIIAHMTINAIGLIVLILTL
jgi:membrane protease YdiL (CAAX protease family)